MIDQEFMTVDEVKDKELVGLPRYYYPRANILTNIIDKIGQISYLPFSSLVGWSSRLGVGSCRMRVLSSRTRVGLVGYGSSMLVACSPVKPCRISFGYET